VDAPYIGLRPYEESERDLLCGRDDDAARLVNKIFSSPLTLLYAASGVGKTSLLRSLVIPTIRAQEAQPIYFDGWSNPNPLLSLKQACRGGAEICSDESLANEIRRGVGTDCDAVLILDQFEIFLIQHVRNLRFQQILGDLIRSEPSVHVLISLREEFLARLNSFRVHVPSIYNSNYRLERLQGKAARVAITKPAEKWGKTVEPMLVEKLLEDLRADLSVEADPQSALQPEGIEAPFLQLVCRRLWFDAEKNRDGQLGIGLYRATGGKDAIIRSYIGSVTNNFRGRQKADAATLLQFLGPPSGVKNSLSVVDLQTLTKLPQDRIEPILNILCGQSAGKAAGSRL
jgi:hypothetical protein